MTGGAAGVHDPVARFAVTAEHYCAWAEHAPKSADGEVETAIRLLLDLMTRVIELPASDPDDEDDERPTHAEWNAVFRRFATLPFQYYATSDPWDMEDKSVGVGDLHDDLADVWRDVRHGLNAYKAGRIDSASWQWSFSFRSHWGEHATEALRVLVAALHAK